MAKTPKNSVKKTVKVPVQPQQKQVSVKEMLFELGNQLKKISATYEDIIMMQSARINELEGKKEDVPTG